MNEEIDDFSWLSEALRELPFGWSIIFHSNHYVGTLMAPDGTLAPHGYGLSKHGKGQMKNWIDTSISAWERHNKK